MLNVLLAVVLAIPLGLDLYMPVPENNPLTVQQIRLGQRLFNDKRLSRDESLACASCHDPKRAFSNPRPISVGVFGRQGRRNVPAIVNRGYGRAFFWDGRITSLEEQVLRPIQDPNEMDMTLPEASARVGLSGDEISKALASYVRSILSGDAPFDRFVSGDRKALTPEQQAGLLIFRGKANCTACHVGPTFSDERFHNTGIAWQPSVVGDSRGRPEIDGGPQRPATGGKYLDDGRFIVTGQEADRGRFKTPSLREVARTSPYMHDGSKATLEAVVDFYNDGGRPNPNLDEEIHPLKLTAEEKRSLVAFLKSLSGRLRAGP